LSCIDGATVVVLKRDRIFYDGYRDNDGSLETTTTTIIIITIWIWILDRSSFGIPSLLGLHRPDTVHVFIDWWDEQLADLYLVL
jgi:hypothetical protein